MIFPEKDTNKLYGHLFILMDGLTGLKNSTNQTSTDGQLSTSIAHLSIMATFFLQSLICIILIF